MAPKAPALKKANAHKKVKVNKGSDGNSLNLKVAKDKKIKRGSKRAKKLQLQAQKKVEAVINTKPASEVDCPETDETGGHAKRVSDDEEPPRPHPAKRAKLHHDEKSNTKIVETDASTTSSGSGVKVPDSTMPDETLLGSSVMSVHVVYARDFQKQLEQFVAKFAVAMEAIEEAVLLSRELNQTVEAWRKAWASGH